MTNTILHLKRYVMLIAFTAFYTSIFSQNLFINEFVASNDFGIQDEFGENEDWVEIYNAGNSPVNLAGYYLTDDLAEPNKHQIPFTNAGATTIQAGGYLIFWFDGDLDQGPLHVDAKLSSGGESIGLVGSDGVTFIDDHTFDVQIADVSEGRETDGTGDFNYFASPTPNFSNNNATPGVNQTDAPSISPNGGLYNGSTTISMSGPGGSNIYYTTDGSLPDDGSTQYTGPFTINSNTPLRAVAIRTGEIPSTAQTETYLYNTNHTFAIVSVVADPDVLFDPEDGLYPNFLEDIEKPANVEMFEPNGLQAFNQLIELEISGTASAYYNQKSLAIKAKGSLGGSKIEYPVFPGGEYDEYRSLVLRNSGQDFNIKMFHDAYVSGLIREDEDVQNRILPARVNHQDYRPGVVYINGEYWGIQNIRERSDKRYIRVHFGLDDDEIDFLDEESEVKEGDLNYWTEMQNYLLTSNISGNADLSTLNDYVDLDKYIDNVVFNVYVDNADWPGNNNRRFRDRAGGAFEWLLKDHDFTYGMYRSETGAFNSGFAGSNSLARLINGTGFNWPSPEWSNRLFNKLITNNNWRHDFVNRMADQINVFYDTDRMLQRIDEYEALYQPEIQQHFDRWKGGFNNHSQDVDKLRIFANNRTANVYNHFINQFGEISGTADIVVNASPSNGGTVNISTINAQGYFEGTWFRGVPIPISATAAPGYVFTGWSGLTNSSQANSSVTLFGNGTLTANFAPINCPDNDNDGVCNADDCQPNNPNFPASPGTSCNDFNANTENDVIQNDGCTCAGTPTGGGGDCDDVVISQSGNSISVSGLTAFRETVQVFDLQNGWSIVGGCSFDCGNSETISNLSDGDYIVRVSFYNTAYQIICTLEQTISINGACIDTDNDGTCDEDDCGPTNPNIPTTPGSSCNDFNAQTQNDVIQQDGCTCQGTPINNGACTGNSTNLALNKSATQSSTLNFNGFASASRAVDGNTDGNYFNGSVAATENTFQGWWEVDLGQESTIESIQVYNRTEGQDRLFDFYVLVSDQPFTGGANLNLARNQASFEQLISGQGGSPSTINTNDLQGRYVRIHKTGNGYVTLAEVIVNGCTGGGPDPGAGGNLPCNLNYTSNNNSITFTGFSNSPHSIFKLFTSSYSLVSQCVDCDDPYTKSNLSPGNYIAVINTYDENWNETCEDQAPVQVGGNFNFTPEDNDMQYYISELFPNPASDELLVRVMSQINAKVTVQIFGLTSGLVEEREIDLEIGLNTIDLNISDIPTGMYNMIIQGSNFNVSHSRFVKMSKY